MTRTMVGLRAEQRGNVAWLIFDRPRRLNSFTTDDYASLRVALEQAAADLDTRVVVITGTGRAFSAGADRSLLDGSMTATDSERVLSEFTAMLETLTGFEKPVIAAVNGLAVGIGCTLLLHCDLVLVAESARLRLPFTALGLAPEAGSSALLPTRSRWPDAVWAMLSSEWIDARAAVAMGIAWRAIVDSDLTEEAQRAAAAIAEHEPSSVAATKRLLVAGRVDLFRAAMAREVVEMRELARRREPPTG